MNDRELLARFVQQNDQNAFAEVVRAHIDWVGSMARRLTHDPAMADDVTQAVFILLARKANALSRRAADLPGWLFAATRNLARNALRAEYRLRAHERSAAAMRELPDTPPWQHLEPMLDELVSRLRLSDRRAVLLRFYQQKTFPQIGAAMEISEDAARKRVERAIDRLRDHFTRRGVTIGAGALTMMLSENLTQPASAAIIATATAAPAAIPVAKSAGVFLTLLSLKPAAMIIAAVLVVAAAGTALVQVTAPAPAPPPARTSWTGRIMDENDKPLAAAKVWRVDSKYGQQSQASESVTTDAQGRFEIKSVGQVIVYAPGHGISGGRVIDDVEEFNQIQICAPTQARVRLIDPTGKPAAGIRAAPMAIYSQSLDWYIVLPPQLQEQFAKTTDADGVCVLTDLPQDARLTLGVLDDSISQIDHPQLIQLGNSPMNDGGVIRLQQAAEISGKVTFADSGKPAAGIRVVSDKVATFTDADGNYRIKKLDPGTNYVMLDLSDEMIKQYAAVAYIGIPLNAGEKLTGKDFALISGGIIQGKVTAKTSGKPIKGMSIAITGPAFPRGQTSTMRYVKTDADGAFMLHVPPGMNDVHFWGSPPLGLSQPRPLYMPVNVKADQTATVNFTLPGTAAAEILGTAIDTDGHPMAGVSVTIERKTGGDTPSDDVITDTDGHFTIAAENGATLHARKGRWSMLQPFSVDASKTKLKLILQKDSATSSQVRVQQADGSPIARAHVVLLEKHGAQSWGISQRQGGDDGVALFKPIFPDTSYDLTASADGFGEGSASLKHGEITSIVLPKADSFVAGIIVDEKGEPVPGVRLSMDGQLTKHQTTVTDEAGHFNFRNVVPGEKLTIRPDEIMQFETVNPRDPQFVAGTSDAVIVIRRRAVNQTSRAIPAGTGDAVIVRQPQQGIILVQLQRANDIP